MNYFYLTHQGRRQILDQMGTVAGFLQSHNDSLDNLVVDGIQIYGLGLEGRTPGEGGGVWFSFAAGVCVRLTLLLGCSPELLLLLSEADLELAILLVLVLVLLIECLFVRGWLEGT